MPTQLESWRTGVSWWGFLMVSMDPKLNLLNSAENFQLRRLRNLISLIKIRRTVVTVVAFITDAIIHYTLPEINNIIIYF